MFRNAIVRIPGPNFAQGLTSVNLGAPDYHRALQQHSLYCEDLRACGLTVTILEADLNHPDSTFVEDTAVLTARTAILTRPGASSRQGEVHAIRHSISRFFPITLETDSPGTLDGGDICEAGNHFFLGLSHRTNEDGILQLSAHLSNEGYTSAVVDIRDIAGILHLKSGISYIGNNTLVVIEGMSENTLFSNYDLIRVPTRESYGANCVRVNDRVLLAAGYPDLTAELHDRGFHPLILDMSEFQKMDGGLSCLSLRF